MKRLSLLIFVSLIALGSSGQSLSKKLLFTVDPDSVLLKEGSFGFDRDGQYSIRIENTDGSYSFLRNSDTLGPFNQEFFSSLNKYSSEGEDYYYNRSNGKLFGPYQGEALSRQGLVLSKNQLHLGAPMIHENKLVLYLDDKIIHESEITTEELRLQLGIGEGSLGAKAKLFDYDEWMHISNNGHCIYSSTDGLNYQLYLNEHPIDSSENAFYQIRVNNQGDYLYAKGRQPLPEEDARYNYMFFLHTKDSIFGPVRTAWNCYLLDNGAYYYQGDDAGPEYILINDVLYRDLDEVANITLLDRNNSLFTYTKEGHHFVAVNGKSYALDYEKIFQPSIDAQGNFALYGLRDYYLYKFVNGQELKEPITRYGVRPMPLYISPNGASLHAFRTDDSTYLHQEDELLYPPLANYRTLEITDKEDLLFSGYERGKPRFGNRFFFLTIDSISHVVFNGQLSNTMPPIREQTWGYRHPPGEVIMGEQVGDHFFIIQKTGDEKWLINVNNTYYQELLHTSHLFQQNYFFDGEELIFYGLKDLSVYQFTLRL